MMNMQSTGEQQIVNITDNAAKQIASLLAKENDADMKFRVSVGGGGCSGFRYFFEFDNVQNDDDTLISKNGAKLLIDSTSAQFMNGATIDYVTELGYENFEIHNPNTSARCGCGNSFSA